MNLTESAEEVLEALWNAQEGGKKADTRLSELRQLPDPSVLTELIDNRILERGEGDMVSLTKTGLVHARDAVRRHRLAERLLIDVLAVKSSMVHEAACQFEHHLHKGIDTNVCILLGHPKFCPHGQPIPPGQCCKEGAKTAAPAVARLSDIRPGENGHIAYLHTQDPKRAQMLLSMGLAPGTEIRLLAGFPSFLFQLGEGQFAVDAQVAGEIYVRLGGVYQ